MKISSLCEIFITLLLLCCSGSVESYRPQLNYTMPDNSPAGMIVGHVGLDSELIGGHASTTLTFSLIASRNGPPTLRYLFIIDPTSGVLYTGSNIDRDVVCIGRTQCVVELTVQARGQGRSVTMTFVKVIISIADENDNRPTFDRPETEVDVTEAASVGSRVAILPRARDLDSPSNGVRRYFIGSASHPGVFAIVYDELITNGDVYLVTLTRLDREKVDRYSFVFVAVDGGSPALSGSVNITVRITDVDDNSPVFRSSIYRATVQEDAQTGSQIATVRAVDADSGANGEVVYSLVRHTNDDSELPFQINSTSGLITTSAELDYESSAKYTLTVRATSRSAIETGSLALAAHAQVVVHVTDVNDNAPIVVIATMDHDDCSNCSHVIESSPPETFVAHVRAVDVDPVNGRTECQLNSDDFRLEKLFDAEYQVVTTVLLDRELQSSYELLITCTDAVGTNSTSLTGSAQLSVVVDDVNDHAPVFRSRVFLAHMAENQPIGTSVAVIEATDRDDGHNADVRYRLLSDFRGDFRLDIRSGLLTTNRGFDREREEVVNITVVAMDLGNPSLSSTANVVVSILDEDDEVAEFTDSEYEFYVEEEQSSGEVFVGQVVAIDRDLPPHNDVIYSLLFPPTSVQDDEPTPAFHISAHNGTIVTSRPLDREVSDDFRLVVQACSPVNTCSSAHVTVHVTDVNDHAPVFLLPATPNDSVSVTNYFRSGDVIVKLVATDADVGDNGRVGYQLVDVDHVVDFYFRLDDVTGDISARRDSMAMGSYTLVVAAVDGGTPPRRVQSAITVVVNISTSAEARPRWASGANGLTIVIVIVGTSLPVAILLLAAIVVLLRSRNRANRAARTSHNVYEPKSSPDNVATNQAYATLSRRTTTRLATAATTNDLDQSSSTPNSALTRLNTNNNVNSNMVKYTPSMSDT